MRVGIGYDVHAFSSGRRLILGGVDVPSARGLAGHSDADVLVHAVIDAILGAAGLGDVGDHFPDSDARWRNVASIALLQNVARMLADQNLVVANVDVTVVLEEPKIAEMKRQMCQNVAQAMGKGPEAVNIKAKTTEGLGFAGRSEGVAAYAIAAVNEVSS